MKPDEGFPSTVSLVRGAQGGDRAALDTLFKRYLPRVRQIVALRVGLRLRRFMELEDVVQECLLSAFQGFDGFQENSEGGFRNWLARFVQHKIVDVARRASAKKRGAGKMVRLNGSDGTVLYSAIESKEPRPSEIARAGELSEKIEEKLHLLSTIDRELIIRRNLCEMSYAEIAKSMGLSDEARVRMAVSRARRRLQGLLKL